MLGHVLKNAKYLLAAGALSAATMMLMPADAMAGEVKRLFIGVGTTANETWANFVASATHVVHSIDPSIQVEVLQSDFQGQKLLTAFGSAFSAGCEDCIVVVDPASNAFTKAIVDRAADAGAKIVTIWNRPENIHPWDTQPDSWVAHVSFEGIAMGYENGKALCKALGGKGNIVALQGVPDNPTAKQRIAGLHKALAECPGVKLLDTQSANWSPTEAQTIVRGWLSRYGDGLNGIFSSNDGMALGAVAALREQKLAGKIPVTGADGQSDFIELIAKGEALSTMNSDIYSFGAVATALAYASAVGDLKAEDLSKAQRDFYLKQELITKDNAAKELASRKNKDFSPFDYAQLKKDFWAYSAGQIPAGDNE